MLDLGNTSIAISPQAVKAFQIPVVRRIMKFRSEDVTGGEITTDGLYTVPLELSFGNHRTYD